MNNIFLQVSRTWGITKGTTRFRFVIIYPLALFAYAFVMHWVYANLISPDFSRLISRFKETTFDAHLITYLIALVVLYFLPVKLERPSALALWILFTVAVGPTILMSPYTSFLEKNQALGFSFVVGLAFSSACLMQLRSPKKLPIRQLTPRIFQAILISGSLFTYAWLMLAHGLSFTYLDLFQIDSVRESMNQTMARAPILGYLVPTLTNVINPYFAAIGIANKKWLPVVFAVTGQLVLYSTTGAKHVLFAILAWLVIYLLLLKKGKNTKGILLVIGAAGLMIFSAIVDLITNEIFLTSLFSRRFLTIPGSLSSAYFKFFSDNPHTYLSQSILSPWIKYPYDKLPANLIAEWAASAPKMSSNVNLFADGFANFGIFGILLAGVILGIYLRFLDRAAVGVPQIVSSLVIVIPAIALSNTSVFTSMFSHGLVAAFLILAFVPRPIFAPKGISQQDVS